MLTWRPSVRVVPSWSPLGSAPSLELAGQCAAGSTMLATGGSGSSGGVSSRAESSARAAPGAATVVGCAETWWGVQASSSGSRGPVSGGGSGGGRGAGCSVGGGSGGGRGAGWLPGGGTAVGGACRAVRGVERLVVLPGAGAAPGDRRGACLRGRLRVAAAVGRRVVDSLSVAAARPALRAARLPSAAWLPPPGRARFGIWPYSARSDSCMSVSRCLRRSVARSLVAVVQCRVQLAGRLHERRSARLGRAPTQSLTRAEWARACVSVSVVRFEWRT